MRGVSSPGSLFSWCALLVFALVSIAGCSTTPRPQPVDANLSILIERGAHVPDGRIVFKPMPGKILGKADDIELFGSAPGVDKFQVPFAELLPVLHHHAAVARSDATNPGELAEPRNLRIARIATFFEPAAAIAGCNNFRTGLRGAWPAQATLVYVDGPGSVRGTRYAAPYVMEYDLEFPAAGVYAISAVARGNHVTQVVVRPDELVARVRPAPCAEGVASRWDVR